jgi:hypothetical protein
MGPHCQPKKSVVVHDAANIQVSRPELHRQQLAVTAVLLDEPKPNFSSGFMGFHPKTPLLCLNKGRTPATLQLICPPTLPDHLMFQARGFRGKLPDTPVPMEQLA